MYIKSGGAGGGGEGMECFFKENVGVQRTIALKIFMAQ